MMGGAQTEDNVREQSLAFLFSGKHRLMPLHLLRHRRRMIHFCLFTEYLPKDGCQPCEAPHSGYGVDHHLRGRYHGRQAGTDQCAVCNSPFLDARFFGSAADEKLPFMYRLKAL